MNGIDTISSNSGYNSSLQLRLDCDKILSDINDFLGGTTTIDEFDNEKQTIIKKSFITGEPLCNMNGKQMIMLRCRSIFNPQAVQGNFNDERYNLYIKFLRQELVMKLVLNRYKWTIRSENINVIVDTIMNFAKPFMSRTLYNKERESYATTMQSKETHQIVPNDGKKTFGF
jgi:hypothetical protein